MAFDTALAERVRDYLSGRPQYLVTEKKMFGGLAFLVNGKMCVNVKGDCLMCRFDPKDYDALSKRAGFSPMIMRGKKLDGYGYIAPAGYDLDSGFDFWLRTSLDYNAVAMAAK